MGIAAFGSVDTVGLLLFCCSGGSPCFPAIKLTGLSMEGRCDEVLTSPLLILAPVEVVVLFQDAIR